MSPTTRSNNPDFPRSIESNRHNKNPSLNENYKNKENENRTATIHTNASPERADYNRSLHFMVLELIFGMTF